MKKCGRELLGALFDLRVIVGACGVFLSIVTHELFHIILHWGEIKNVHVFPGNDAIVAIVFTPSMPYNLVIEEGFAYGISMVAFILTVMLIHDISSARNDNHEQSVIEEILGSRSSLDRRKANEHLAAILEAQ